MSFSHQEIIRTVIIKSEKKHRASLAVSMPGIKGKADRQLFNPELVAIATAIKKG